MEKQSNFFSALVLCVLGTIVHSTTLDISSHLDSQSISLITLFQGASLPPTATNLLINKIALFFLLWGFLKAFSQKNQTAGGFTGALLIAIHPLVSYNAGYLTVYIAALALFWWSIVFSQQQQKAYGYFLPLIVSLTGSVLLSPWMLILYGVVIVFSNIKLENLKHDRLTAIAASVALCIILLISLTVPFFDEYKNQILLQNSPLWVRNFLVLGMTFDFIYSWGAVALISFGIITGIRYHPQSIIFYIASLCFIMFFVSLDIGGILILWILFSTLTAMAFDSSWKYLLNGRKIWIANISLIVFVICLFQIDPDKHLYALMKSKSVYKTNFHRNCGASIIHPEAVNGKLLEVHPADGLAKGCWLALGNYHYNHPGHYRATFYMCQNDAIDSFIDVSQGHGRTILGKRVFTKDKETSDCSQSLTGIEIDYNVTEKISSPIEHRVFYNNQGSLYFDRVEVEILDKEL